MPTDVFLGPRLSHGEQVQDLQAALAKAVKEANYLKAHCTWASKATTQAEGYEPLGGFHLQ